MTPETFTKVRNGMEIMVIISDLLALLEMKKATPVVQRAAKVSSGSCHQMS